MLCTNIYLFLLDIILSKEFEITIVTFKLMTLCFFFKKQVFHAAFFCNQYNRKNE